MTKEGYIEKIKFHSDETGYTVMTVETTEGDETFVGKVMGIGEGMYIVAEGEYVNHPKFDIQFAFTSCETKAPDDVYGIEKYLGSGIIKGVGEVLAKRIVAKFKMDTMRILEEEPERLAEIKGISEGMARRISESYDKNREFQDVIIYLSGFNININLAIKIYNEYGSKVKKIMEENPYRIAEDIPGVGFKKADEIALKMGNELDSVFRMRAAIIYVLNQSMGMGHIYIPEAKLIEDVKSLIVDEKEVMYGYDYDENGNVVAINNLENDKDAELIHDQLIELVMDKKIMMKKIIDRKKCEEYTGVYLIANYYMELNSARYLIDLKLDDSELGLDKTATKTSAESGKNDSELDTAINNIERANGIEFEETQKKAIKSAIGSGVAVITGGPGTGKTTIINAIIEYFENQNMEVCLAAPTGRAAKRITESTGYEAKTIHRLLEFAGVPNDEGGGSTLKFGRNGDNPLECDVVIIDEASMIDSFLFYALLQATLHGTRLILVGDTDQLPSVGAGNVLHDIIESKAFPVTELTKIFRQAEESAIIENAHKIKNGEPLKFVNAGVKDFFFYPMQDNGPKDIIAEISNLVTKNLPNYYSLKPTDIQILAPTRIYELGVEALNVKLQEAVNPAKPGLKEKAKGDVIFREGDKVMQIKNNYKLEWKIMSDKGNYVLEEGIGVFNGDMGFIKSINDFDEEVTVLFDDGRQAVYSYSLLDELEHAFAVTIHKSQGSEYPAVIIPLYNGSKKLLSRNLIYTAITRAKSLVVIIGKVGMVNEMIANVSEKERYTSFAERIKELSKI